MLPWILFLIQLIILFLLARSFSKNFFRFWYLLTKSQKWSIWITSFLLLPGTVLHELSHWLVAEILQVPTGQIKLWPELEKPNDQGQYQLDGGIKLGSVAIARSDPFRRTFIGLAPLIVGLFIICTAVTVLPTSLGIELRPTFANLTALLVIFLTSNAMFSSKKDMEAAFVPFFLLGILVIAWWYFAWPFPHAVRDSLDTLLVKLNYAFLVTILIDVIFLLLVKILTALFGKMLKRRLVARIE